MAGEDRQGAELHPGRDLEGPRFLRLLLQGSHYDPAHPRDAAELAISIRQHFNLYANVRPVKSFPNQVGPLGEVDFVCVREGTEGLYSGVEEQAHRRRGSGRQAHHV